jgi:polar amino acid transport system substrate-binding protein
VNGVPRHAMGLRILVMCALAAACAPRLAPMQVRIATNASLPPFEWIDTNSRQLLGFDIDVMNAVAVRANLQVSYGRVDQVPLLAGIADCRYDGGISAIEITDALKQQVAFSTPYYTTGQVVVVKKGNLVITGRDSLKGMTVGAAQESPGAAEVQKIAGARLQFYPTADMALQELINGLIDAVITDLPQALIYANVPANNLKTVGGLFDTADLGIALCKQRPELVQRINTALAALQADGTLDQIRQRWLAVSAP